MLRLCEPLIWQFAPAFDSRAAFASTTTLHGAVFQNFARLEFAPLTPKKVCRPSDSE
jgi:hypothetical protein